MRTRLCALILIGGLVLQIVGCGKEGELPADEVCNHGPLAIMETESGYYTNIGPKCTTQGSEGGVTNEIYQSLCYYDKEQQIMIPLCDKPECEHGGDDSCVASYKNIDVENSILYDGAIYIYATEKVGSSIEFNLYKAAMDGSSIDKVGCVFQVENSGNKMFYKDSGNKYSNYFIIHKGYAYLPYYAKIGRTVMGFKGGGVMQMDLKTGDTRQVYEMETANSSMAGNLFACGDYVYMQLSKNGIGKSKRYHIPEDKLEDVWVETEESNDLHSDWVDIADERYQFEAQVSYTDDSEEVFANVFVYDAKTGRALPEKTIGTEVSRWEFKQYYKLMVYQDMLLFITDGRIFFYSIAEDSWGEKLAEIPYDNELYLGLNYGTNFSILNDKLYYVRVPNYNDFQPENQELPDETEGTANGDENETDEAGAAADGENDNAENDGKTVTIIMTTDVTKPYYEYTPYKVFSWPLEDILSGRGEWKFEFEYENFNQKIFDLNVYSSVKEVVE